MQPSIDTIDFKAVRDWWYWRVYKHTEFGPNGAERRVYVTHLPTGLTCSVLGWDDNSVNKARDIIEKHLQNNILG